jgi:hypothetical protein
MNRSDNQLSEPQKDIKSINQPSLLTLEGQIYEIPNEGSLGLLALGYEGVNLWREKRNQIKKDNKIVK